MATSTSSLTQTQLNMSLSSHFNPLYVMPNSVNFNYRRKNSGFPAICSLNLPLEPKSPAGKSLSTVLQNQPQFFYDAVSLELKTVKDDRDAAFARLKLSLGSPEASLHRRIAELKEAECQTAVEDVLYMIILHKFSEIRVPLVPSLSRCLYNGRLEILPSKDWELESIHSLEVLDMVKDHLSVVLGWKAGSSVAVNWSTTKVQKKNLSQIYAASILFGYFLKSASLRLHLEQNLPPTYPKFPVGGWMPSPICRSYDFENISLGHMLTPTSSTPSHIPSRPEKEGSKLRCYVTGLDMQTRQVCAKLKSLEAVELIENHCAALFGNSLEVKDDNNEVILTSLSSMKRLVLEAVAFGCFLWDAEQCVSRVYKLKDRF